MTRKQIVVTGMGVISPVGHTVERAWENVLEGRHGFAPITHFDPANYPTRFAGEVKDFDPTRYMPPKDARKMDPFMQYGVAAGKLAFDDAGLAVPEGEAAERMGVIIGAGIGGILSIEKIRDLVREYDGPKKVSPFFVPGSIINMVAGHLSILYNLRGPNLGLVTACTTGTHCIGYAARIIERGDADVMLAGGAEMAISPGGVAGFCSARALSTRNDNPGGASRPWDRDRDGFVLSDGAAVLVIESLEHARSRGARIWAELIGFGVSGDAYHITAPPEDGAGAALCMRNALKDAGIAPETVDYVNAHGTSTVVGDLAESRAIKAVWGAHASRLAISSTKSVTGHLLGAAGAIEAIFSILALRDQVIPATFNLEHPDPECDLDYVPNQSRKARLKVVLSNSFGFGGTNGTLVFRACP
ncbi:MAG: beta-ketoacyl-ACP synthase II [Gammaproteobacteria bacterium]